MQKKITDAQIALFVSGELNEDQMLQIQNAASKDPEIAAEPVVESVDSSVLS